MLSATKRLVAIDEDILRRAYWVLLVTLDNEISKIETAIYWRANRTYRGISATDTAIHNVHYHDPLALARNALLQQRNEAASICGIRARRIHDISDFALGYVPWGGSYAIVIGDGSSVKPLGWTVGV